MIVVILAYLLGAVPAGYLINKYFGNAHKIFINNRYLPFAFTNMIDLHGHVVYSILADVLKGWITVWVVSHICTRLLGTNWTILIFPFVSPGLIHVGALLFAILGHVFVVYICGWGGRGTATAFGGFLLLTPIAAACAMFIFIITAFLKRSVSIASLAASWVLPVLVWYFYRLDTPYQVAAVILAMLSLATHYDDLLNTIGKKVG